MLRKLRSLVSSKPAQTKHKIIVRDEHGVVRLGTETDIIDNYFETVRFVIQTKKSMYILKDGKVWAIEPL